MKKQTIYIFRGLPGSGKSTRAQSFQNIGYVDAIIEADQFFMIGGEYYQFNAKFVHYAHQYCQSQLAFFLNQGWDVAIANTFCTRKELYPYLSIADDFGAEIWIYNCLNNFGSIHDVPEDVIQNMKERWEEYPEGKWVFPN